MSDDDDYGDRKVLCARCGRLVPITDATPEEGDEWECLPCNRVYDKLEKLEIKLSEESKRADDMMHRGDSWREMCDELEAKLKGCEGKLDRALDECRQMMSDAAPEAHKEAAKWRLLDALEGREPKP